MTAADAGRLCLLKDREAWLAYASMVPKALGIDGTIASPGPKSFPCLVGAIVAEGGRIATCYVYVDNAVALLKASGDIKEATVAPAPVPAPGGDGRYALLEAEMNRRFTVVTERFAQQDEFNRSMLSHAQVAVALFVDTGIVRQDGYEKRYAAALAGTDRTHAERTEAARLEKEKAAE